MSVALLAMVLIVILPCTAGAADQPTPTSPAAPEAVRWLRDYLQIDTTNPPGNELAAAEFLAEIFASEGIASRILTSPNGRASLYARLQAPHSNGRALLLTHHLDVVPASDDWQQPPFSGRLIDGRIWGRGAIDVKSLGIAHLAAMVTLARAATPLVRDVVFLGVADEEQGGIEGTGWLLDQHPELFDGVEGVLGEGGSNRVLRDRLIWWGIEIVQKRPLWLTVTASGRGGHASGFNPRSATHQLLTGLTRLIERPLRYRVTDAARNYLGALAELEGKKAADVHRRLDRIILEDGPTEPLSPGLPIYFLDTLQVTEIDNGRGSNVIAAEAKASVDIRLLPDSDEEAYLREIRKLLGDQLDIEVELSSPPVAASPIDHALYRALAEVLEVRAPVVPIFISGTTDSRYFRQRNIPAYGFAPFTINAEDLRGIHARDELIAVDDLLRGIEIMRRVVTAYATDVPIIGASRGTS